MSSFQSKVVLFLGVILLSGCEMLGTMKPICDGQKLADLPDADKVKAYTMAFGQDELPRAPTHLIRTDRGHYRIHAGTESDSETILEVCRIGERLVGTIQSTDPESQKGPYLVFRIENTADAITWYSQVADLKDLDSAGIHYTTLDDEVQGVPVHSTQVDLQSAAQVSSLLNILHDDKAEGLRLVLGKN